MSEFSIIALDLAKNVFQMHGADASGTVLFRKKLRRDQILKCPAGHFKFLRVWSVKFLHPRGRTRDC
ncbi:hypothetical protein AB7M74_002771 [Bradyrhizobium japonicum]